MPNAGVKAPAEQRAEKKAAAPATASAVQIKVEKSEGGAAESNSPIANTGLFAKKALAKQNPATKILSHRPKISSPLKAGLIA